MAVDCLPPMWTETLLLVVLGFGLVLLNGFFVAAEFAIVKLRRTQADGLARTHGLRGRILRTVRTHLDAYLSACQLGITLASLGLGTLGFSLIVLGGAALVLKALALDGLPRLLHLT